MENNLTYEIHDTIKNMDYNTEIDSIINNDNFFSDFQEEYDFFDEDNLLSQHIDYYENYTIKLLHQIAGYYKIKKNKIKKRLLVQLIIEFENNPENSVTVYNRKRLWHYLNELKEDEYFSKYILS
jgi:hypothetical protein